tara:strand:+ start:502 stop:1407 length:906 start_codon:yes stop_codon:yes gene_type:complete
MILPITSSVQELSDSLITQKNIRVFVVREDLIHPDISGNKWRKLYYNIQAAKQYKRTTLVTFGGAYSNHIVATAAVGKEFGFKTIGFIRGEEHLPLNPSISYAVSCGMEIRYIDRMSYKLKDQESFLNTLLAKDKDYYLLPEGGSNELAVKGCEEIVSNLKIDFDIVCCACGTGGTISGIINSLKPHQRALGFPALKGAEFLNDELLKYVRNSQWDFNFEYHFGGYAKVNAELINFINLFKQEHNIPLDPVYTGKMFFGVWDLIKKDYFRRGSSIVLIHTGGLQGIKGMNQRIKNKGLQIL